MNVAFNKMIIKIANDDIPETYQQFISETLPQNLSPIHLPPKYILSYLDAKRLPIRVMNELNYKTMRQVMSRIQDELDFFIVPEQQAPIIKVEEGANELPLPNLNPAHPIVDEVANENANPQSNEEPAQNKLEDAGNDQGFDKSPIIGQEASAQINEDPQSMAEPVQANPMNLESDKEIHSLPIYTHENIEWVVNENDALRKGLSERIEESQSQKRNEKSSNRRSKGSRRPKLQNEVKYLEKSNNMQRELWKDLEEGSKKIKTSPVACIGVTHDQSKLFDEKLNGFGDKWKKNYELETDFERGFLKVTALQERITGSRFRPNTTITDGNIKTMMNELLAALRIPEFKFSSLNISNLAFSFENCHSLSKTGLSYLFQTINKEFKNVRILNLNFSFNPSTLNHNATKCEMALDLHDLETLSLNFNNRWDITHEETIMLIESVGKNSKDNLKSFNFFLPFASTKPKAIGDIRSKFDFVTVFD